MTTIGNSQGFGMNSTQVGRLSHETWLGIVISFCASVLLGLLGTMGWYFHLCPSQPDTQATDGPQETAHIDDSIKKTAALADDTANEQPLDLEMSEIVST